VSYPTALSSGCPLTQDPKLVTYLVTEDGIRGQWPDDKKNKRKPFLINNIVIASHVSIIVINHMNQSVHLHWRGTKENKDALGVHLAELGPGVRTTYQGRLGNQFYIMVSLQFMTHCYTHLHSLVLDTQFPHEI
jgi:hypothetical protein